MAFNAAIKRGPYCLRDKPNLTRRLTHTYAIKKFVGLIFLFSGFLTFGQITWDGGAGTHLWSDAANWDPDGLPGNGDDVVIDGDSVVINYDLGVTIDDIDIINGGVLNIVTGGNINLDNSGGNQGNVEITDGTLYISGGSMLVGDFITVDGSNSQLVMTDGTLTIDGDTNPLHDLLFENGATGSIGNGSELYLENELVIENSSLTVSGYIENTNPVTGPHDIEMRGDATLIIEEGAEILMEDIDFDNNGSAIIIMNGGSLTLTDDLKFNNSTDGDSIIVNGGEITVESEILIGSSDAEIEVNGGTITAGSVDGNTAPIFYDTDPMIATDTLFFSVEEDSLLEFCVNIFDAEDDSYFVTPGSLINATGTLTKVDSTCFEYQPDPDFNGVDYSQFTVCDQTDSILCSSTIIEITTTPGNDAPYFYDTDQNIKADTLYIETFINEAISFCVNVFDDNNDDYVVTHTDLFDDSGSIIQADDPDRCFQINPNTDFLGTDLMLLTVCEVSNPGLCSSSFLRFTTVPIPPISSIDTLAVATTEDNSVTFCTTEFDIIGEPYNLVPGTLVNESGIINELENECFEYVPSGDFNGEDFLAFELCEKDEPEVCTTTIVHFTTTPVNDPPAIIFSGIEADTVFAGTAINTPINITIETIDVDGDSTFISALNSDYALGDTSNLSGLNFDYTPLPDTLGSEFVEVVVCDAIVPALCDTAILRIQFPFENTAPEFVVDNDPVDTIRYNITDAQSFEACVGVLDREKDLLTISSSGISSGSGSFTPVLDDQLCFVYDPGDSAVNIVEITVCDDQDPALCSDLVIEIEVNHQPRLVVQDTILADSLFLKTGFNLPFDSCFSLIDIDGDSLIISDVKTLSGNGAMTANYDAPGSELCLSFSPILDFTGTNEFVIDVSDDGNPVSERSIFVSIEVLPFNSPPVFILNDNPVDSLRFSMNENDVLEECFSLIDAESDDVIIENIIQVEGNGIITIEKDTTAHCISFTPEIEYYGTFKALLEAWDGKEYNGRSSIELIIDILPVNNPPTAVTDSATVTEGDGLILNLTANDIDPENEGIILDSVFTITAQHGTVTVLTDSTISYVPEGDYRGMDEFAYAICDLGVPQECAQGTVVLDVAFLPRIPVVYEAFSPNGDGINDAWIIDGIEDYPNNTVMIFNQWNSRVFDARGYNNVSVVWKGEADGFLNKGSADDGTYYYVIDLGDGSKSLSGFVILKR